MLKSDVNINGKSKVGTLGSDKSSTRNSAAAWHRIIRSVPVGGSMIGGAYSSMGYHDQVRAYCNRPRYLLATIIESRRAKAVRIKQEAEAKLKSDQIDEDLRIAKKSRVRQSPLLVSGPTSSGEIIQLGHIDLDFQ